MQVDFIVCGAQKAGTTSLDAYCRQHPDIGMSLEKEVHYFDNDDLFRTPPTDYSSYHQAFPQEPFRVYGETTPVYLYWPQAAERIHAYNPSMKLVVLLRHPVDRAYSHWQMETARGHETLSFGEAIRTEAQRLATAGSDERRVWSYVGRGCYLGQIQTLWNLFGTEQVLILDSDELRRDPGPVLDRIAGFLDISPFPVVDDMALNAQSYTAPMQDEDRQYLLARFAGEISALEDALGWQLDHWRK